MNIHQNNNHTTGIIYASGAYFLWGILPIYWKLLQAVDPLEILAHRITWCLIFLLLLQFFSKQIPNTIIEIRRISKHPTKVFGIISAAIILSLNWYTYIWAVNNNFVIQASLGYYINPLVSILLAVVVLKEKLNIWQIIACALAFIGVFILTNNYGGVPWVALILAFSFAMYGLIKKMVNVEPITGLILESAVMAIFSLIYLCFLHSNDQSVFSINEPVIALLLVGTGLVTSIPLVLFARAVKYLPLSLLGFLQYINPTISLLLGIFVFHEVFSFMHLIAFIIIWTGLIIFSLFNNYKDSEKALG
ncbi:MAG TPA: EamA family transporter RarD [Syntrophomonadaceae bacterium]|nr:EamA family transporter RarD [Syntrophomonadaceae bacterium]